MTLHVFIGTSLAGGLYALVLIALRSGVFAAKEEVEMLGLRLMTPSLWKRPDAQPDVEVTRADRRRRLVPYAAMICVGFFARPALPPPGR